MTRPIDRAVQAEQMALALETLGAAGGHGAAAAYAEAVARWLEAGCHGEAAIACRRGAAVFDALGDALEQRSSGMN